MKSIFITLMLFFSICIYSQQQVVHITPQQIADHIENTSSRKTVIQFWNPNCKEVLDIVKEYKAITDAHDKETDFYFVAITSKDSLIINAIKESNYTYTLYVADASVNPDLYERMSAFCKKMCRLLHIEETKFLTLCLDKNDNVTYKGDAVFNEIEKVIPLK